MSQIIKFPFGAAEKIAIAAFAAVMTAEINNTKAQITIPQMTAAATLNLTVNAEMTQGADINIRVSVDGTNRVLTPGTGMTGLAVTLTASKSYNLCYEFDGSSYVHKSTMLLN